jgi:hypothetical protein
MLGLTCSAVGRVKKYFSVLERIVELMLLHALD